MNKLHVELKLEYGRDTQNISLVLPSIKALEATLAELDLNFPGDGLTQSVITYRAVFIF